jgi:branched-chain amino acid transport system substrate-binding protein
MRISRRLLVTSCATVLATPRIGRAQKTAPIRIGEINSYTAAAAFTLPYRKGWQLAVEQVNQAGGVLGRPIEVISRDDAGNPADAVRAATELVERQNVDLLAGTYRSDVGLAVSDYAHNARKLFIASEPITDALVWQKGHRYCYRLRSSTYMLAAMLVQEAAKADAKRWATVAPNYEYGQSAVRWFRQLLKQAQPDIEFVGEQWPAVGNFEAGATVAAIERLKPDGILNVTFGADQTNLVRQGNTRGLFDGRVVASFTTGEPEYLQQMGDEAPVGWIVTGYPDDVSDPRNRGFVKAYTTRFGEPPRMGSVIGYSTITAIAAGISRSRSAETEAMADGFAGAEFDTPFGRAGWRAIDHQSTLGTFVGRTALKDGRGIMVDWRYVDGITVLPPDNEVRSLRPG